MICLVFLDMESNTLNSQGPFKQKWTPIEDLKQVEALVENQMKGKVTLRIS